MPLESQIQTLIGDQVILLEHFDRYIASAAQNFFIDELQIHQDLNLGAAQTAGDRYVLSDEILGNLKRFRSGLSATLQLGREMLEPTFREYGRIMGFPEQDLSSILLRLREDFWDSSKDVASRRLTFGSVTDLGGGAGDGDVHRLNADEQGEFIESAIAQQVIAECISDEHSGATEHEEIFELRGETAGEDFLDIAGSGSTRTIKALSAVDSRRFVQNPSFSDDTAADPITSISGWTISSGTYAVVTTPIFRSFDGDSTPRSVRFDGNGLLTQNFNVLRAQFSRRVPLFIQVAFQPGTATAGDLRLRFGASTITASITTADSTWRALRIGTDTNNHRWFRSFNEEDPTIELEVENSNGSVFFDDIVIGEMIQFQGVWYAIVGSLTPFLQGKRFRWTDTVAAKNGGSGQGLINHWLQRLYGFYLPHTTGTPTWTDPNV